MGVYIKGLQLPEKSDMYYVKVECEAGKNPVATIWRKDLMGEMSFGAFEVIPVPPHGGLIDAYATKVSFVYAGETGDWSVPQMRTVLEIIEAAPTIIEAEEAPAKDINAPTKPYDLLYEEGGAGTT